MATKKNSIRGTKTEENLLISYLAESSAYTRYTFYAQQADKENYSETSFIQEIFAETQEKALLLVDEI